MKTIPLVDLKAQYKAIKSEINPAINRVLEGAHFILGSEVEEFEKSFASFCGTKYAIGVASGLNALELGMRSAGIKEDDEIITPTNSFIASSSAISLTGAKPVLVDCEEDSFNIDPEKIGEKITKKTKAIIPVHLYGRIANMDQIMKIAKIHKLQVIEDACQAHGAKYHGRKAGSIGLFGAFSFYPGKNLGAYGDGGIITTNNAKIAQTVGQMRNYGQSQKYHHDYLAWNSRLDTIQAAILLVKLKYLNEWNKARLRIAKLYNKLLKDLPLNLPQIPKDSTHVFHLYVIRTKVREKLAKFLGKEGITTGLHYPIPIHLQKAYKDLDYKKGDFPVSEKLAEEILTLPIYPELKDLEVEYIAKKIKQFFNQTNPLNPVLVKTGDAPFSTSQ